MVVVMVSMLAGPMVDLMVDSMAVLLEHSMVDSSVGPLGLLDSMWVDDSANLMVDWWDIQSVVLLVDPKAVYWDAWKADWLDSWDLMLVAMLEMVLDYELDHNCLLPTTIPLHSVIFLTHSITYLSYELPYDTYCNNCCSM